MLRDVVIVGASLAGLRAAETLRTRGFDGTITLLGAESHLPYDRPPLSKKVLAGEWEPERIALRKEAEYHDLRFDLRLGVRADALDPIGRTVTTSTGEMLRFDGVIIATGARPRRLPGQPELDGIVELRTMEDCLGLRARLAGGPKRVVVIGAGFIGAEVAATAHQQGHHVTVLEALAAPVVRGLGEAMGGVIAELHRANGVDLRLSCGVDGFEASGSRVAGVRLSDGTVVEADVVVVGVGVTPNVEWLADSGLELRDGIVCDATLAAGPPGVYAAGDVTRWPNALFGEEMRVEHWTNAAEQGAAAADNLLASSAGGEGKPYAPVPFFWSDQFDARLQFLGRGRGDDHIEVVQGSVEERRFVALYERDGLLKGALGLSVPKLLMPYRKLLASGATWDEALAHAQAAGG